MNMLALTIILPLIGFVLLAFSRGRWSENVSAIVGVGSVGLAALVTAFIGVDFFANGEQTYSQPLWTWMSVGDFNIGFNLVLDGLSLTMLSVVTGVGFLIHMYASWYMRGEEGYSRFFAYTNLFIASMVVLVLADNLLLSDAIISSTLRSRLLGLTRRWFRSGLLARRALWTLRR